MCSCSDATVEYNGNSAFELVLIDAELLVVNCFVEEKHNLRAGAQCRLRRAETMTHLVN